MSVGIYDSAQQHFFYTNTSAKSEPKPEPVKLNPNMAWRLHRKMKALSDCECDVCGGPCGKYDTIELDSGLYYVCCDDCADEAVSEY